MIFLSVAVVIGRGRGFVSHIGLREGTFSSILLALRRLHLTSEFQNDGSLLPQRRMGGCGSGNAGQLKFCIQRKGSVVVIEIERGHGS